MASCIQPAGDLVKFVFLGDIEFDMCFAIDVAAAPKVKVTTA